MAQVFVIAMISAFDAGLLTAARPSRLDDRSACKQSQPPLALAWHCYSAAGGPADAKAIARREPRGDYLASPRRRHCSSARARSSTIKGIVQLVSAP